MKFHQTACCASKVILALWSSRKATQIALELVWEFFHLFVYMDIACISPPNLLWLRSSTSFLKNIFIDYTITAVPFSPIIPLHTEHPLPPTFPPFSSCPWVISLASTFPILFLPSPIFYLPSMLLILHIFSPSLFLPLPCC
ncbi:hypothetical protein HJG60_008600 [Phyllostomus discolor]|uniref:Uncharacterized protein n=1 Tax=Phyllostomus discolor TaxID=89673 RepID=A0A833Z137_9CHIR|nr:hypothetical protein HJG60_008600 [Phyllostomus discolor]